MRPTIYFDNFKEILLCCLVIIYLPVITQQAELFFWIQFPWQRGKAMAFHVHCITKKKTYPSPMMGNEFPFKISIRLRKMHFIAKFCFKRKQVSFPVTSGQGRNFSPCCFISQVDYEAFNCCVRQHWREAIIDDWHEYDNWNTSPKKALYSAALDSRFQFDCLISQSLYDLQLTPSIFEKGKQPL